MAENVKIAIIDTGLDRSIYDLRDRVDVALNFLDADQTIEVVELHPTAVAGIIGATTNNGRGIVGIAPGARMYSLSACWESGFGSSRGPYSSFALGRVLDWAISNKAKIVNMSLQGDYDPLVSRLILRAVTSDDTRRAIDYRWNAGKGCIAPGEEILTTMPSDTYDFISGASFASAHVSGIVALLVQPVPTLDAHTLKAVLPSSTCIANWTVSIDACAALATVTGALNCRPLSH